MYCLISHPCTGLFLIETPHSNAKEISNGSKGIGYPKVSQMDLFILGMNEAMDLSLPMPRKIP